MKVRLDRLKGRKPAPLSDQTLASDIKALHDRYADTLTDIDTEVAEKESAVLNHLKSMGFTL